MVPFINGTYNLIMADKQQSEVPVSRKQARNLKMLLGIN
jgi:two-component system LytT family response regulator/two-component system response regulator LytT